jgi:hypothetical protein
LLSELILCPMTKSRMKGEKQIWLDFGHSIATEFVALPQTLWRMLICSVVGRFGDDGSNLI